MSNARNLANLLNTDTTIATADVANGGITTAKLADDAVTSAKLDTNIAIGGTLGVTGVLSVGEYIRHIGDTDTQLRFTTDTLQLYVGNNENITVGTGQVIINQGSADCDFRVEGNTDTHSLFVQAGSDHVGINNSSPNSSFTGADNLVIGGGSGHTGMTILSGTSSRSSIEFSDGTGSDAAKTAGGIRYYHDSNYMRFNTNGGTERLRIDSSGRVGINTSSPANNLHVMGSMTLEGSSGTDNAWTFYKNTDQTYLVGIRGSSNDALAFYDLTADVERMRIDTSGRLGIGDTSPDGLLSIKGDSNEGSQPSIRLKDGTDARQAFITNQSGDLILGTSNSSDNITDSSINIFTSQITFKTAGNERMRIDSTGRLFRGSTSDLTGQSQAFFKNINQGESGIGIGNNDGSGATHVLLFKNSSGLIGSILTSGSATSFNTSSDYRLKENISYTFNATTRLKQLKPARFNWIDDATNTIVDGFIAHEVSSIVPEAVSGEKDATRDRTNVVLSASNVVMAYDVTEEDWTEGKANGIYASNTTWSSTHTEIVAQQIDQAKIIPLLVKTIQELEARITVLESA